ncbi:MAG: hypothetical protein QOI55_3141, partial [Actinomycetota bacterium]|nr:hypothetical protein [Actinomycetota bacterium]
MRTSATARWSRWSVFAALLVALAIVAAACGSSGNKGGSATTAGGGTTAKAALTDSFRGVTKDAIKVGIVMVDYKCIAQFVDFNRGDQKATYEVFVKDINDHGGILGRKLTPVYKTYCPIQESESLQLCSSLTDDENVFAVIGVFVNASNSGASQLCVSRDHETVLISHEMEQAWIDQAPPGLMLTTDITAERRLKVLTSLLKSEKTLEGKTVAVLTDASTKRRIDQVVTPALANMGIKKQGSTAVLTISGTDTSNAQNQLDSFIEKWKGEHVDALIMGGGSVSNDQFVNKIGAALPGVLLVTDQPSATLQAARKATEDKVSPNPYKNVISVE